MSHNAPIGVVFDFDGTLTPKEYGSVIAVVEHSCLPEPLKKRVERIRKAYLKIAAHGPVAPAMERRLIAESLRVYAEAGLNRLVWQAALAGFRLREGVMHKIRELTGRGIRVGIVSYGVADFIEHALHINGLGGAVHKVYAARLFHDGATGNIIGWNKHSVVHPFDKCVWSACFARHYGIAPDRLLAVGDSTGDRLLGLHNRLRLGIAKDEEEAKRISPFMGETVVTEHFSPVGDWIDRQISLILAG